jgi:hypothetical protein
VLGHDSPVPLHAQHPPLQLAEINQGVLQCIAMHYFCLQRDHHLWVKRRPPVPIGPVPAAELAQIQNDERQIVLRQPLPHVHRHQQRLITLREKKILRHAS